MSIDFAAALSQEIATLEFEISSDPRLAKLRELKRIQAQFYVDAVDRIAKDMPSEKQRTSLAPVSLSSSLGRRPSPERDRIIEEAEKLVRENAGNPVPTATVVLTLEALGIEMPGTKPINNVSAILSTSGRFVANGRRGWTMAKEIEPAEVFNSPEEEEIARLRDTLEAANELYAQGESLVSDTDYDSLTERLRELEGSVEPEADEQRINAGILK